MARNTQTLRAMARRIGAVLVGILVVLVLLESGLRLEGYLFRRAQQERNRTSLEAGSEVVILCLGESTTAHGADGRQETAWPRLLEEVLNQRAGHHRFAVINRGQGAADSSLLMAQLAEDLEHFQPLIVVSMMGANDGPAGAVPYDGVPMVKRTGFPYNLKTYRLVAQLLFDAERSGPPPRPEDGGRPTEGLEGVLLRVQLMEDPHRLLEEAALLRPDRSSAPAELMPLDAAQRATLQLHIPAARGRLRQNPSWPLLWRELGHFQLLLGDVAGASGSFQRAAELGPEEAANRLANGALAWVRGELVRAEKEAEAAHRLAPGTMAPAVLLAEVRYAQDRSEEGVDALIGAFRACHITVELDIAAVMEPINAFFRRHGDEAGLERLLLEALGRYPTSGHLQGRLARCYLALGRVSEASELFAKANEQRGTVPNALTRASYRLLHEALDERGIRLVAVQYPGRPLDPLLAYFDDPEGIVFVDNEATFKQALDSVPYHDLFGDHCYGDFGHATRRGNLLLATNIADAIIPLVPATGKEESAP